MADVLLPKVTRQRTMALWVPNLDLSDPSDPATCPSCTWGEIVSDFYRVKEGGDGYWPGG